MLRQIKFMPSKIIILCVFEKDGSFHKQRNFNLSLQTKAAGAHSATNFLFLPTVGRLGETVLVE